MPKNKKSIPGRTMSNVLKPKIKNNGGDHYFRFTLRQLKYKKNRLMGMNIYNAARAAGYSESYSKAHAAQKVERVVKVGLIDELDRAGATDQEMAKALANIAKNAKKMQSCTVEIRDNEGNLTIEDSSRVEVPDLHLQKDTWETIAKLKKHLSTEKSVNAAENIFITVVLDKVADVEKDRIQTNEETDVSVSASN